MSEFTIDELAPEEIDAAIGLWQACGLTRPWNDPHADARLALEGSSSTILAGRLDGRLAATAMVGTDGHRGWVYYLATDPACRGHGFGERMMRAAERFIADQGVGKIQLMVRDDNGLARGFYETIGYARERVSVYARRLSGGMG